MNAPISDPLLALEALLSDADDELLRTNLSRRHFRELRRERARIGLLRLKPLLDEITTLSQRVAHAWDSASADQKGELEVLSTAALQARSEMLRIRRALRIQVVFPLTSISLRPLEHYKQMRQLRGQLLPDLAQ